MTSSKTNSRLARRGLTLIELLVALTLGVVVLLVAYTTFRTGARVRARAAEMAAELAETRTAQQIIRRDLRCALLLPEEAGLPFTSQSDPAGEGQSDVLQFVSLNSDPLMETRPTQGIAVVQYRLERDPDTGETTLMRYSLPPPLPEAESTISTEGQLDLALIPGVRQMALLRHVRDFIVLAYDPDQQDWVPDWTDTTRMPRAVRLDIAVYEEDPTQLDRGDRNEIPLRQLQIVVQLPAGYHQLPPSEETEDPTGGAL